MIHQELKRLFIILLSTKMALTLAILPSAQGALGATRKAMFNSSGYNSILNGLKDPQKSNCMITVTNVSNRSQTIAVYGSAHYDIGAGAVSFTTAQGGTNWMPTNVVNASYATVQSALELTAGETRVYYIDYPPLAAAVPGSQTVGCAGYITAQDTDSTLPGYVLATGTLTTFVENGAAVIKATEGVGLMRGSATMSQTPITIGEGRPF